MAIIDHGKWVRYTPTTFPEGAPPNAMFCKRESDGKDWYNHVNSKKSFLANSVKFTVRKNGDGLEIINAPAVDATMLFPADSRVIELAGRYAESTIDHLIEKFAGRVIDLKTGKVTELPSKQMPAMPTIEDLLARIEKLERGRDAG